MIQTDWKQTDRSMKILLVGVLLAHLATYIVLPVLPIFLKIEKGMSISEIGIILAVSPFAFQVGSILGGIFADRIGRKPIIASGAWVKAAALLGFGAFHSFPLFLLASLASGLGTGLNAPATKAAIAALASEQNNRTHAFALRGIAANIGISIAGLMTYFALGGASILIFYVAASLFILLGVVTWQLLPAGCGHETCEDSFSLRSYVELGRNRVLLVFSLVSIWIWALYAQLALAVPLRAALILSDPNMVSLIWTVNSMIVILLQKPISSWILNRIHPFNALALGVLFIGGGIGSLYWSNDFADLIMSGVIFIIGEMLVVPTMDSVVSQMATAEWIGVFFGIANVVSGMGEAVGNYAGGQLLGKGIQSALPWVTYGVTAVIVSVLLLVLKFWGPMAVLWREHEMEK